MEAFDHRVDELLFHRVVGRVLLLMLELLAQILFQLIQGVEFADVLGKLIVGRGQLLALDFMQLALEYHRLAGELLRMVFFGEGDVNVKLLLGAVAGDLLFKSGDKLAGSQLERIALALSAVKGNAV